MDSLTITPELASVLNQLMEKTELRDTQDGLIGLFTPKRQAEKELAEQARQLFDLEEARRRAASERGGRTTHEVLARLQSGQTSR